MAAETLKLVKAMLFVQVFKPTPINHTADPPDQSGSVAQEEIRWLLHQAARGAGLT